ncbi:MAG: citramalate synthase [Treponema sp.]|nr:citramalate synthase [Treponema sp.]
MINNPEIEILDTTLRDGAQGEGINFSLQDKIAVLKTLDELGAAWIEAGNPGSNPKDMEFFHLAGDQKLEHSRLCAFGSTRKKNVKPADDDQLLRLLEAGTEAVAIVGKSWDLHVREVLRVSNEENLAMISDTVSFLKDKKKLVFFDAEHFFDGWIDDPEYAVAALKAAAGAGADRIVLCDTNGGAYPQLIEKSVRAVAAALGLPQTPPVPAQQSVPFLGIHAHNDTDLAIANTLAAVNAGCLHVQGTLAGFGERCGNTCLASLIPTLQLKFGRRCLPDGKLELITAQTRKLAEIANVALNTNMPYVGRHAFSHKGGMHADGILKNRRTFEHVDPSLVGNDRHFLVSEVGGRSAIAERARKIDPSITKESPVTAALAEKLKSMEAEGWAFEGADASFEILVRRSLGRIKELFKIEAYRVVSEHPTGETIACSHAWVKVLVEDSHEIAAAEGNGPVHAMDSALRRALKHFFPELEQVRLSDYKVRVIDGLAATASKVRVLITSSDGKQSWTTVGVSGDILEASRIALTDSIEYKLITDMERRLGLRAAS